MQEMWVDGKRTAGASGRTIAVHDPATEEIIDLVPAAGQEEVAAAVGAASAAFAEWRRVPAGTRAELLHEVAVRLTARTEALAELLTREGGKPLVENRDEMGWSAACFRFYAELGRAARGRVIPSVESSQLNLVLKEPYGVVGAIVPWNYPILLMAWKVAPALAAGNTVVIKPSEMTPLSTLACAEIFEHLPPGVVNIVTGTGAEAGEALVQDARVRVHNVAGNPGYKRLRIRQPVKKILSFIVAANTILCRRVSLQHYHWEAMFVNSPACLAVCWKRSLTQPHQQMRLRVCTTCYGNGCRRSGDTSRAAGSTATMACL